MCTRNQDYAAGLRVIDEGLEEAIREGIGGNLAIRRGEAPSPADPEWIVTGLPNVRGNRCIINAYGRGLHRDSLSPAPGVETHLIWSLWFPTVPQFNPGTDPEWFFSELATRLETLAARLRATADALARLGL